MSSTTFTDFSTPIVAGWLNDVNDHIYDQKHTIYLDDYGAVGDGVTNDAVAVQAAFDAASASGACVMTDGDKTYYLGSPVVVNGGLILKGEATFTQPYTHVGMIIQPPTSNTISVTSYTTVTYPSSTGNQQMTELTVSSSAAYAVGDTVMVYSADTYGFETGARRAELMVVAGTAAGKIYLSGTVKETYSTSINVMKLSPAKVIIDGPTFTYAGTWTTPAVSSTRETALTLIGCVHPYVNARFINDIAAGLQLHSCYKGVYRIVAKNLRNNSTYNMLGYGVANYSASRGGKFEVYADNVRHAYTDGIWNTSSNYILMGRPRETVITGQADNCSMASWDTHKGAVEAMFINCVAVNSQTDNDQPTRNNSYHYQVRGLNMKMINCVSINAGTAPFYFDVTTCTYGETNNIEIVGGFFMQNVTTSKNMCGAPAKTSSDTLNVNYRNCVFSGFTLNQTAQTDALQKFHNCEFTGVTAFGPVDNIGPFEFYDCTFKELSTMRMGVGNNITMVNCKRINSGSSIEGLRFGGNTTNVLHNYYASAGSYGTNRIVEAGGGSDTGNITIHLGPVYAKGSQLTNPIQKLTSGTLTITHTGQRTVPVLKGTTANRPSPSSTDYGYPYMDTTLDADGKMIWWNGSAWVDATGATA